jgi:hypothetical protein
MTKKERCDLIRTFLEQAMVTQRSSWDLARAAQEVAGCGDRDVYALVTELASALHDGEAIPDDIVAGMINSGKA